MGAITTLKKELLSYAVSPVSWVIAVLFYLVRGFELDGIARSFAVFKADPNQFPSATYGAGSTFYMVLLVPGILTMRCFAEERRTGSIETLMTGSGKLMDSSTIGFAESQRVSPVVVSLRPIIA